MGGSFITSTSVDDTSMLFRSRLLRCWSTAGQSPFRESAKTRSFGIKEYSGASSWLDLSHCWVRPWTWRPKRWSAAWRTWSWSSIRHCKGSGKFDQFLTTAGSYFLLALHSRFTYSFKLSMNKSVASCCLSGHNYCHFDETFRHVEGWSMDAHFVVQTITNASFSSD